VTLVQVTPGPLPLPAKVEQRALRYDPPVLPATVPRGELWSAALSMIAERPIFGSGPDSFRHLYGRHLGLAQWDKRLHANNLYLEILADFGVAGSIAFALLVAVVLLPPVRRLRSPAGGPLQIWAIGTMASMLAFFVHGLLDYFFQFTSLYLLFWMLLGLVLALERTQGRPCDRTEGASSPPHRPR
jgi:putative inorganic carbon (hco3(-)) transporter